MAVLVKTNVGGGGGVGIEQIIKENGLSDLSIIDKNKGYVSEEKTVDIESLPITLTPGEGVNGFRSVTINKPDDLVPEKILKGNSILGITGVGGTDLSGVTATPDRVDSRYKFMNSAEELINGTMPVSQITATASQILTGYKGLSSTGTLINGTLNPGLDPSIFGGTKLEVMEWISTSSMSFPSSIVLNHSLGKAPFFAMFFTREIDTWSNTMYPSIYLAWTGSSGNASTSALSNACCLAGSPSSTGYVEYSSTYTLYFTADASKITINPPGTNKPYTKSGLKYYMVVVA